MLAVSARTPMPIATWDGGMARSWPLVAAQLMTLAIIAACAMRAMAIAPTAIARMVTAGIGAATKRFADLTTFPNTPLSWCGLGFGVPAGGRGALFVPQGWRELRVTRCVSWQPKRRRCT